MGNKPFTAIAACAIAIIVAFAHAMASAQQLPLVKSIEIRGLKRIEEGAVRSKIIQRVGDPLSHEKTSEDIKTIFRMGYFDDVRIEIETLEGGIKLIYLIKEKPTIIKVDFQGNHEIKEDKLREKLTITPGSIADTTLIQDNVTRVQLVYEEEGYWLAKVVPIINRLTENEVSLTFQIEEGEKIKIKTIAISGNRALSSGKIKAVMKTGEWTVVSFLTSSGYYKKETMLADLESIRDLYFNNGYIKVVVSDPDIQLTSDKKGMVITIQIAEGDQYKVSSVSITGNKAFTETDIRRRLATVPGAVFSKVVLRKDIASTTDLYTQNGYATANVYPDIVPDDATKQLALNYRIEEGPIYRLGRVEISGNTKTKDKVIRRELRVDEGDIFNSALLKRSYERLNNLNFFETVEMVPRPRAEEHLLDVDVKVKEKATGFISVGGGYSSVDKFIAMVDITQGNVFGTGRYVKLKGELGGKVSNVDFSFRDPWFMDKPISFSADIYKMEREYIDYKKKATGLGFGFGKSFREYLSGSITYNLEQADIFDVADSASSIIRDQIGERVTSSVTPTVTWDSRDSYIDPSRGTRNQLFLTFAGLGGDNKYIKGLFDSAWFFPIGPNAVAFRARFGYATGISGQEVPLYERFCVGGIYTVRGLGYCEAGPKDSTGTLIGGTKELIFNTEFIFPILTELRLKGVVFFDAGNAYDQDESVGTLRYTTGAGIRWASPVGPIRIEWGYNLDKKPGEKQSRLEFAFGSFF